MTNMEMWKAMKANPELLRQFIRRYQKAYGVSLAELAKMVNVSETSMRDWKSGRSVPSYWVLHGMCLIFGDNKNLGHTSSRIFREIFG